MDAFAFLMQQDMAADNIVITVDQASNAARNILKLRIVELLFDPQVNHESGSVRQEYMSDEAVPMIAAKITISGQQTNFRTSRLFITRNLVLAVYEVLCCITGFFGNYRSTFAGML